MKFDDDPGGTQDPADSDLPAGEETGRPADTKPPVEDDEDDTDVLDTEVPDTDVVDTDLPDTDPPLDTSVPAGVDDDGDGVPDTVDNCLGLANPAQADRDRDGDGDLCDPERDGDGLPNAEDPWPDDPSWPGRATNEDIYVHTSGELYRFNVPSQRVIRVGAFTFNTSSGSLSVTDLAIDRNGVLYATTFDQLFVCRPDNAACRSFASMPGSTNGLTFVPPGTLQAGVDTLVGTGGRDWYQVTISGRSASTRQLGTYDSACGSACTTASGDAFSVKGVGTFASVYDRDDREASTVVEVDPLTGAILRRVVRFDDFAPSGGGAGHARVYGLAGWTDGFIYAFDESGDVLKVDVAAGTYTRHSATGKPWWGAAVRTVLPGKP